MYSMHDPNRCLDLQGCQITRSQLPHPMSHSQMKQSLCDFPSTVGSVFVIGVCEFCCNGEDSVCNAVVVVLRRVIWHLVLLAMLWSPSTSSEDDTDRVGTSEGSGWTWASPSPTRAWAPRVMSSDEIKLLYTLRTLFNFCSAPRESWYDVKTTTS